MKKSYFWILIKIFNFITRSRILFLNFLFAYLVYLIILDEIRESNKISDPRDL